MSTTTAVSRRCVALIAHDSKKEALVEFARRHLAELARCEVVATQATAMLLRLRLGLDAVPMRPGPDGGDLQIAAKLAAGEISAVFFLRDVMVAQPHEADILALLRICDVCDVPYATNVATAWMLAQELFGRSESPEALRASDEAGESREPSGGPLGFQA
ncbi:methylglyoxal synthase [Lysobacter enzymogenes]|uniref:methylglyoxal synthase n=1 Tax=Lysobacter enzymogenes TaxID=69 RepID=UPI003390E8C6